MLVNNVMAAMNNTLGVWLTANHDSNIVTKTKKDTTMRCQFHRDNKGEIIENFSWVAATLCFNGNVLLLNPR